MAALHPHHDAVRRRLVSKFGKTETEAGALRGVIAEAIERGMPTSLFVPHRDLGEWREFAGGPAIETVASAPALAAE